jgi:hypothetical protein
MRYASDRVRNGYHPHPRETEAGRDLARQRREDIRTDDDAGDTVAVELCDVVATPRRASPSVS